MENLKLILILTIFGSSMCSNEHKIHPNLRNLKDSSGKNIFVKFKGGSDAPFNQIESQSFANREDKIMALDQALGINAMNSQAPVINFLNKSPFTSKSFTSFPTSNEIFIKNSNGNLIKSLSGFSNVAEIREEEVFQITNPIFTETSEDIFTKQKGPELTWGVKAIKADKAWEITKGEGVVVAVVDTGVNYKHKALIDNYRNDEYSWYNPENKLVKKPVDKGGHGTHITGSIIGKEGIGVAIGAKWIACRGCGDNGCTESNLKGCGEWVRCANKNGEGKCNPGKVADVVNNSWGGGQNSNSYDDVIRAYNAIGIVVVFAAGNSGNGNKCKSLISPGDRPGVIGVGATDQDGKVSGFSSKGPPGEKGLQKPNVGAPGGNIKSASHKDQTSYTSASGTSCACPHVSGAAALIKARNKSLNTEKVMDLLQKTAVKAKKTDESCEGKTTGDTPNWHAGYGLIDVDAAIRSMEEGDEEDEK